MSLANNPTYSGGCQCGAVRFRIRGALGEASICHCRMCQKAFGAFYAPLVSVTPDTLEWTRGAPSHYQSSSVAWRGFCSNCGTPLTMTYEADGGVAIAIGAFDRPEEVAPSVQWGTESKLPYIDGLPALPGHESMADEQAAAFLKDMKSRQHPDHDTHDWPPRGT